MKVFILWLLLFSFYSYGSIPNIQEIKESLKNTINKYRSEWIQGKRQQIQEEICSEKNIDTLLNESSCKGDPSCLEQLPQIKKTDHFRMCDAN